MAKKDSPTCRKQGVSWFQTKEKLLKKAHLEKSDLDRLVDKFASEQKYADDPTILADIVKGISDAIAGGKFYDNKRKRVTITEADAREFEAASRALYLQYGGDPALFPTVVPPQSYTVGPSEA